MPIIINLYFNNQTSVHFELQLFIKALNDNL